MKCDTLKYKGFKGVVIYDNEFKIFHGEVVGIRDVITFQAENINTVEKEFKASVEDYLAFCKKVGKKPDKYVLDKKMSHMGSERDSDVPKISLVHKASRKKWINEAIGMNISQFSQSKTASRWGEPVRLHQNKTASR